MARRKRVIKTVIVRKQQAQQKRRPRNRRRSARVPRMSRQLTRKYALSLADPWSEAACIPDGANGVGCFSVKDLHILGTGAGGSCTGIIFNPQGVVNFHKEDNAGVPSTAATPTLTGNYSSSAGVLSIQGLYAGARLVSAGIKVKYVGNTQTDQGILILGQVSELIAPSAFNGLSLTGMQNACQNYKVFPLRAGGSITWRPQSMDDAMVFGGTAGSVSALTVAPSVPWLFAYVYGASASTASLITCDLVANYEGQYRSQNFLPGGIEAIAKPAEAGWYESALNALRSVEPIVPFVGTTLTNAFNSPVASTAMQMLLGTNARRGLPRLDLALD